MPARFGRIVTAMATPFAPDGKVDLDRAAELALRLVSQGSEGLVLSGSTGESPTLSFEEKVSLFACIKKAVAGRAHVIAGTGSYCTEESVRLTRAAEKAEADAVLCVLPYYNKPTQEGIFQHFAAISRSTALPMMVYNIPSRTVVNLLPETAARLAELPNMAAIKESSGNLEQIAEVVRLVGGRVDVYSGDDALTVPVLAVGGVGIVSVASHLVGTRMADMVAAFIGGDVKRAASEHLALLPLFKALFVAPNPTLLKSALRLVGFAVGGLRLPLVGATQHEEERLAEVLKSVGLL